MHPIIHPQVAQAQIADLHRQTERDRTARAAALARKTHDGHSAPPHLATLLARRLLAVLAAHSPRRALPMTDALPQ